jgi:predicted kinase
MKQLFINVVGMPASGKSTLIDKLAPEFALNVVDGDKIRNLLNEMVLYYQDPGAVHSGPINDSFAYVVDAWRVGLVKELMSRGQSVIVRGGINPQSRAKYQEMVRSQFPGVPIIMIDCQIDEPELVTRLEARGDDWVEKYHNYFSKVVKPPEPQEYDELLVYTQDNYDPILTELKSILSRT